MSVQKPTTKQRLTKVITGAYSTTDVDCGYRLVCNSAEGFTITLHTASDRYNFELEIDNVGAGTVTCGGKQILSGSHAHVGNDGTAWVVVIGGGAETDPIFSASPAAGIGSGDISNWNTAFNHSQIGQLGLGETETTAYRGDRGKTAYDHSQLPHAHFNVENRLQGQITEGLNQIRRNISAKRRYTINLESFEKEPLSVELTEYSGPY